MERLVKGDQVVVTTGKDRGKQGEVLRRVLVHRPGAGGAAFQTLKRHKAW